MELASLVRAGGEGAEGGAESGAGAEAARMMTGTSARPLREQQQQQQVQQQQQQQQQGVAQGPLRGAHSETDAEREEGALRRRRQSCGHGVGSSGCRQIGGGCRTCWRKWHGVVLGQLLSLLLTGTGVFSEALFRSADVSVPGLQNFIMYAALATIYGAFWFRRARRKRREQELAAQFRVGPGADSRLQDVEGDTILEQKHEASLAAPWYVYALIALADVQGNFLAVLAYRYTTIASATLLDCFSIPVVMVLSRLFLRVTYGRRNFAGVLMCLCGLSMVVLIDLGLGSESETRGSNPALGDALVVLAASCYAVSNVAQEVMVKRHDRIEYLFLLGSFGCFFAGIQVAATEHETLSAAHTWPAKVWTFILGYVVCLFGMYSSISKFLETFDAAFLNISLLSSDVWAVFAGHLIFHDAIAPLYVLALLVIVGGVLMYNSQMPEGPTEARERQYFSGAMDDLEPIEISDETPRAQSRFENLALAQS